MQLLESKEPMDFFFGGGEEAQTQAINQLQLFFHLYHQAPQEKKKIHWPSLDHVPLVCPSIDSLTKTSTDNREDGP